MEYSGVFLNNFHISHSHLFKFWQFTLNSISIQYMKIILQYFTDKSDFLLNAIIFEIQDYYIWLQTE